ncbi:MAG TPA: polyphosphate kinase 1 [Gemmatimonadaceae bacterium]|nr:polyphosphate kinase 1 [Gemmatimonadaceae bacterium]
MRNPHHFRYEVRSARHLGELASAPLPVPVAASEPKRSQHRDLYLDTADNALRNRNIVCRLRLRSDDKRILSLTIGGGAESPGTRIDSPVKSADVSNALAEPTEAGRRLSAIVDPKTLLVTLELETERLTRSAESDWLGRPRMQLNYDCVVVRRNGRSTSLFYLCIHQLRGDTAGAEKLGHAMADAHHLRLTREGPRDRAELLLRWKGTTGDAHGSSSADGVAHLRRRSADRGEFLNPELSLLAFQSRVLAIAEDKRTPLAERLRFLGIVSSNIDEFFMVRMAGLRRAAREESEEQCDDGLTRGEQLQLIGEHVAALTRRQSVCADECLHELEPHGIRILSWQDLDEAQRIALRAECREQIHPSLTPMAMTLSPGHPLPHLPHLTLALAVVRRDPVTRRLHLAELELPTDSPRFIPVPGRDGDFVTLEEVVRSNIDLVYPGGEVESVYAFRVTRGGELALDEESSEDLIDAVDDAARKRSLNPAVRVEVEHEMPEFVRDLLLTNLRREDVSDSMRLGASDIHEVTKLLDLRCLGDLELPRVQSLRYPKHKPRDPLTGYSSILDAIRESDLLFHHPFDSFDSTVVRFLRDAADDPDVTAMKITLYRIGNSSGIAEALIDAAKGGKKVVVFVELKARFDEGHNVGWARKLEKAGGHVVSGLVGYKNHAKAALVIRREGGKLKSYAHVGTGNYNSRSAREYTDLSLFSAKESLAGDVADLFNSLTGGSLPPLGLSRGALVAPHQMKDALIALIEREASHARDGKPACITAKMNGLSDSEVIRALVKASSDGVDVDLVCRGICTLKPGVPGVSERIRVLSVVGRLLEHSRIYRFENNGTPDFFIGSADLRPRNLTRRVELIAPVIEPKHQQTLQRILDLYVDDPTAWQLGTDGTYTQRPADAPGAQERMMSRETAPHEG